MEHVLVVASSEKGQSYFLDFLRSHAVQSVSSVFTGGEARRTVMQQDFDLVIINAPLRDEFGHKLAVDLTEKTQAGVVLIVKTDLFEAVSAKVETAGVIVAQKPFNRMLLYQSMRVAAASGRRLEALQKENQKLHKKVYELQLVGRAKCALVQYRHLTEQEAHRYIEKQAMDRRIPRLEIAEDILQTYEDV
ncbi:MAG: ANTAR domain-containing protein [Oscillospiraceae bacterium]|nr:ANTAR domain-containing protein [Oscillospiraceae bacterium]MDD3260814.1 ANTAR domain-containing protein [Oscillospiraceae bacterium]